MTSSGREPKIYLRGVTPHTHTWWPRPPPSSFEELGFVRAFIAYLLLSMSHHFQCCYLRFSCFIHWKCEEFVMFASPRVTQYCSMVFLEDGFQRSSPDFLVEQGV